MIIQQHGEWETKCLALVLEDDNEAFAVTHDYLVRSTWTSSDSKHHTFSFIIFVVKDGKRQMFNMDSLFGGMLNTRIDKMLARNPLPKSDIYDLHSYAVTLLNG